MNYILDENGEPKAEPDIERWAKWLVRADWLVARTQVGDGYVSNVFLGFDHAFGQGPPELYETMTFGGPLDEDQVRYRTRAEAEAGHKDAVEAVREAIAQERQT